MNEGMEVVIPEGTSTRTVPRDTFQAYKEALSGLTQDNMQEVTAKLVQLGLAGGQCWDTVFFPFYL
jgi:hypothetical protein